MDISGQRKRKMKIVLLSIVTMVITTVNGAYHVRNYRGECFNRELQNFTDYDTTTQMCCNGYVYQKNPNLFQSCCGTVGPYAIETHTCCGNEILPIDSELKCCNRQQPYNDSTHICCGQDLHERHGEEDTCCGPHLMNQRTQTCCPSGPRTYEPRDGTGHCCGLDKVYRPQTQICCESGYPPSSMVYAIKRNMREDVQCCGLDFYVMSAKICCDGVSHNKGPHTACCGKETYNTQNQVCCHGVVSNATNGRTECCGKSPYNPTIEQCCYFTVSSIANGKCCSNQAYHPSESSCCEDQITNGVPEIEGVQKCCGSDSYLETEQICCNGELQNQQKDMNCCGKNMYNTTTHLCCAQDTTIAMKTSATRCCGSGVFESDTDKCCEMANKGFPGVDSRCCHETNSATGIVGVVAYDPKKSTCCSWRQYERLYQGTPEADARCCTQYLIESDQLCDNNRGHPIEKRHPEDDKVCPNSRNSVTYNSETEVCTTQGTVMLKGETQEICGQRLYDTETQICCQGMIHSKYDDSSHPKVCCQPSVHAYVPSRQACCAGRVSEDIPSIEAGCCGNIPYDTKIDTCDQNGLVRPATEVQRYPNMCGNTPYHPDEYSCCQGIQLVGQGQTCCSGYVYNTSTDGVNAGQCCGPIGYDPDSHICCGGMVRPKAHSDVTCCGDALWDPITSEEICCDGILQPILSTSGDRLNCSGQLAFNDHRETICDGVRHNVPNGQCCGRRLFDAESEICCNELVQTKSQEDMQCCGNLPFIPTDPSALCCNNSTLHHNAEDKKCCGTLAIDINQKNCCTRSENPYSYKTDRRADTCCSTNTAKDTCCHGNLHLNVKDGTCCGSAVIRHPDQEICCGGVKVRKEHGEHSECCGQSVIDSRMFSCCNGRRIRKGYQGCCNNQVFNSYQSCCGSNLYYTYDPHALCCNNTLHNASIYGCCNSKTYTKGKYECCDGVIFDAANQVCQEGKVGVRERRQTTDSPMCNGAEYDADKEGCCGGLTIYSKDKLECCNDQIYNPINAVCCGDSIRYKRNGACCGPQNKAYNTHKTICCDGVIRSMSHGTQCCGRKAYHNDTQMCCENRVHDRISNTECCGNQIFSPDREICCRNSSVVDSVSSYLVPSCYTKIYETVSDASVWVQKAFGRSKGKAHKRKHPS